MSEKGNRRNGLDRRAFVKTSAAACAAASLGAKGKTPNVILITADDLGWRDPSCFGNDDLATPNIDRLAAEGVKFTNAFVTAPSCSASRSSIITGRMPHSVGVLGLTHAHTQYQMSSKIPTLPGILRDAGYNTAIHGKWHVAAFKHTYPYGYNHRFGIMKAKRSWPDRRFISMNKNRPFYLEINYMHPHRLADGTFKMDPEFPVDPDCIKVPEYWRLPDWPAIREDVAKYYSQTMAMDKLIGEVLDHLEEEGLAENTLVMFVSDNGPPYPGCKTTCYDRGIGTPLILRWPGGLPKGKTRECLASTLDLAPTALEAARLPTPAAVTGGSLLGASRGEEKPVHEAVFSEVTYHLLYTPMRAIRTGRWKYIENLSPDPTGLDQNAGFEWARRAAREPDQRCCVLRPPQELFDIKNDPHERINLAEAPRHAATKENLRARLNRFREETNDPFPNLAVR